jgi:AcrR family transcriptional regulator
MRRHPTQSRARATVEAIQEAAALLLERGDDGCFTTNHIAERAGVSIGSLYEYFKDKDDIVQSRGEAEAEQLSGELRERWIAGALSGNAVLDLQTVLELPSTPFRTRPALADAILRRYAKSPWAISLAQRHLDRFLCLIGDDNTKHIFGNSREKLIADVPRVAAAVGPREA